MFLATGQSLVMLNPGGDPLPEHLGEVGAVFVDREATGLTLDAAADAVRMARARALMTVIRTDGLSPDEITACAGLAPDGLVLPQVVSASQLVQAVDLLRRSPIFVIAQIETVEAVDALSDLMDVDGIDGFLIGPNDLSVALGHPGQPDHDVVRSTVETVAVRLAAAGRVFGLPITSDAARRFWCGKGAQLHYLPIKAFLPKEKSACP